MPADTSQAGPMAREIADRLRDGARGVSLVGPQPRIDDVVACLLHDLHRDRLLPVAVQAATTTPEMLREAAGRIHAERGAPGTILLLIVADAGRLSAEMLRELEQAAEAAISPGGLALLLGSTAPLQSMLRDAGLIHLHDCLDVHLSVPPEAPAPRAAVAAAPAARDPLAARPSHRPATPARRRLWLVLPALILVGLLVAVWLLLPRSRPEPAAPMPPARSTAPAPAPVPSAPAPAPVTPIPAPVSPTPAPANPAPPPPAPPAATAPPPVAPAGPTNVSPLLLVAQPGDTLPVLYAKVYAGNTPPPYPEVVARNPVVKPGTRLIFPAPPDGWRSRP